MKSLFGGVAIIGLLVCQLAAADAPATFQVSSLTFARPATWKWVEVSSPMRKAQLEITDDKAKGKGEVVFFHFGPNNGGGTKANVDRWFGQFVESRDQIKGIVEEAMIGQHKVSFVTAEGTYKSGMPGEAPTPMPNYALLGAIVEAEGGSVFIKLTGPKDLVKGSTADFRKMVESAAKK
jgi:hypothetical protein